MSETATLKEPTDIARMQYRKKVPKVIRVALPTDIKSIMRDLCDELGEEPDTVTRMALRFAFRNRESFVTPIDTEAEKQQPVEA